MGGEGQPTKAGRATNVFASVPSLLTLFWDVSGAPEPERCPLRSLTPRTARARLLTLPAGIEAVTGGHDFVSLFLRARYMLGAAPNEDEYGRADRRVPARL